MNDARQTEQHRRGSPDGGICRRDSDDQRAETHQQHRQHERLAPAVMIGKMSEQPAADRPHDKADCKENRGIQLLYDWCIAGKERAGKVQRKGRIRVKVVPLDKIPYRSDEDRLQAAAHIGEPKLINCCSNFTQKRAFLSRSINCGIADSLSA